MKEPLQRHSCSASKLISSVAFAWQMLCEVKLLLAGDGGKGERSDHCSDVEMEFISSGCVAHEGHTYS